MLRTTTTPQTSADPGTSIRVIVWPAASACANPIRGWGERCPRNLRELLEYRVLYLLPHTREWRFATRETLVGRASAHSTVKTVCQKAHLVVHSEHKRAVNRLLPRGSPSRHGALLAHESTVELSHSSSHGANRRSCHAEKSISIVRLDAPWHSLAVDRARHSAVRREQSALSPSQRLLSDCRASSETAMSVET